MRQTLDPQVTTLLEQIHAQAAAQPAPQTPLSQEEMIAETRPFMASTLAPLAIASESVARVEDREIPGPGGKLRIRSYAPETGTPLSVLVYHHGVGLLPVIWMDADACPHTGSCVLRLIHHKLILPIRHHVLAEPGNLHRVHREARLGIPLG